MTTNERSYQIRRALNPGSQAVVTRNVEQYGLLVLEPGERVEILAYTNMGFGGINATVRDAAGLTHFINAGLLGTGSER